MSNPDSQMNQDNPQALSEAEVQRACELLSGADQVALAHLEGRFVFVGRAYDPGAARRINELKRRSAGRPLVMCFPDLKLVERAQVYSPLLSLLPHFKERVTVSVPAPPNLPSAAHSGVGMIGVRRLDLEPLNSVMRLLDEPLLISSANPTGRPAARHLEDLEAYGITELPMIGSLPDPHQPSVLRRATVVGLVHSALQVLSPGDTSLSEIKREWERLQLSGELLG